MSYAVDITKTFNAPRETVFKAWAEKQELEKWFGPEGFGSEISTFKFSVGGKYTCTMKGPDGSEHTVTGEYTEIVVPEKIVMTWQWEGFPWSSVVTLAFKEVADGTELHLVHSELPDENAKTEHNKGWASSLEVLAKVLV